MIQAVHGCCKVAWDLLSSVSLKEKGKKKKINAGLIILSSVGFLYRLK